MYDVLKPKEIALLDFITASNCFGSPLKTMLAWTLFGSVHRPVMKCKQRYVK